MRLNPISRIIRLAPAIEVALPVQLEYAVYSGPDNTACRIEQCKAPVTHPADSGEQSRIHNLPGGIMKKSLRCEEMGISCGFEVKAESADQIKDAMIHHAETFHSDMMAKMSESEVRDMEKQIEKKIH